MLHSVLDSQTVLSLFTLPATQSLTVSLSLSHAAVGHSLSNAIFFAELTQNVIVKTLGLYNSVTILGGPACKLDGRKQI